MPVPDGDKERNSDAAKKAAMQQELMLDAAAKAYVAQAEAKAAEAAQRRKEVEAKLKKELGQLEAINAKLQAENDEMRKAKEAGKDAAAMPPQVVFQESRLSSEVRDKIDDMVANKTAERIAQLLATPASGDEATHSKTASIGERGLDRSKEAVLGAGATVDAAQKRIMELLIELEGRTRLEGIRLRLVAAHSLSFALYAPMSLQRVPTEALADMVFPPRALRSLQMYFAALTVSFRFYTLLER